MKKYYSLLTVLILAVVCVTAFSAIPQESLSKQLIGEWRNIYLKIKLNINDAKSTVMEVDSSNWEARLKIKPIRTHFMADGSYYSEYFNLKDSIVRRTSGTWAIKYDTLTMAEVKPEKSTLKLHISIAKNRATFSGIIDFNGDGKVDDEYYGIQKKFTGK
jgi:hypothetical protein